MTSHLRSVGIALSTAGLLVAAAGCAASSQDNPTPTPTPSPTSLTLAESCAAVSAVLEDIYNADGALEHADIDQEEWSARIDSARSDAEALSDLSHSEGQAEIKDLIAGIEKIPDTPSGESPGINGVGSTSNGIADLCAANGTELVIKAQYGG